MCISTMQPSSYILGKETRDNGVHKMISLDSRKRKHRDQQAGDESISKFYASQRVKVFLHEKRCWKTGKVIRVSMMNPRNYIVVLDDDQKNIPLVVSGTCLEPLDHQIKSDKNSVQKIETSVKNKEGGFRRLRKKFKSSCNDLEAKFSPGMTVEVRSDEPGYEGAWYEATIFCSAGVGKFMVEYKTLVTDDGAKLLKYVASEKDIRPYPPAIPDSQYKVSQEVDAWFNEGWWEGVISEVLDDCKYIVYFASTNEDLIFRHTHLRPHQSWIQDTWVIASQRRSCQQEERNRTLPITKQVQNLPASTSRIPAGVRIDLIGKREKPRLKHVTKRSQAKFDPGMTVEVRSDQEVYEGAWYEASVVGSAGVGKFLVEYNTLVTDDTTELLKEVEDAKDIRPKPPKISQLSRFKVFQEIDAWYNDGWWEGVISKVLDDFKYIVYFASTNQKFIYKHQNLRPHQDWVRGSWVLK